MSWFKTKRTKVPAKYYNKHQEQCRGALVEGKIYKDNTNKNIVLPIKSLDK
jgi:hypothetical protein